MISVSVPVSVLVIFGRNSIDYQISLGVMVKTAYDIEHSGLSAARMTEYGDEFVFTECD